MPERANGPTSEGGLSPHNCILRAHLCLARCWGHSSGLCGDDHFGGRGQQAQTTEHTAH